ncbi:TetR/AcrR family transcriptional regulator [Streptomyces sp. ATCC 21386]|uniref:TetR/AcrR family transcriptional regulator n=1 Tax=Streptomyces sp. ATCC 21386 TaxID=2699428 RepID=UPI002044D99C|nr:TetR/AcrR family transcriptional regulator [Streptomyces sp. ATCC 21386]
MSAATRTKLLEGALRTLVEQGIAKTSARSIAATAGVNQALVFYHFGSVDELLAEACRYGAEQRVARHRERMAAIGSLSELLAFGREMHVEERAAGHVAVLGQLLAGAQTQPRLAPATAAGLDLWIEEVEGHRQVQQREHGPVKDSGLRPGPRSRSSPRPWIAVPRAPGCSSPRLLQGDRKARRG